MAQPQSSLSWAAAVSLLKSAADIRVRTVLRWLLLAAVPIIPTMVELADWPKWVKPPFLPSFHVIYWWAGLVLALGGYEIVVKGQRRVEWLVYWQQRARTLAGNMEEVGQLLLGSRGKGGGKPASPDRVAAGILQQIVNVVTDLTRPREGVHIMACMLVPVEDGAGATRQVVALQATTYNENAGRNKSRIPISTLGPATEAYKTGQTKVVADTGVAPYEEEFRDLPYRSVMAYPVHIGSGSGHKLAVVTIDATEPNHFNNEVRVTRGIDAAIYPYLKLIGLVRIAELKGGRRASNA